MSERAQRPARPSRPARTGPPEASHAAQGLGHTKPLAPPTSVKPSDRPFAQAQLHQAPTIKELPKTLAKLNPKPAGHAPAPVRPKTGMK